MEKLLVSACLLGDAVRYDGQSKRCPHPLLQRWLDAGRVLPICPEVAGGLPVPRPAAEIEPGRNAEQVLRGEARVLTRAGEDVTPAFLLGADHVADLVRSHRIRIAVLKENSPSCGSQRVNDGRFSGQRIDGSGVTAARLRSLGLLVFSEEQLDAADHALNRPRLID